MALPLPRILCAVPQTWQARFEIAKAIRTLAEQGEAKRLQKQEEVEASASVHEIAEEIAREALREFRKAGFNPNEPRVPAGNSDGGQWTNESGSSDAGDPRVLSDATPDNNSIPGAQYAANDLPGIGHNQGPPLGEPPEIPPEQPATHQAINAFLKGAAYWLADAALAGEPIGDFLLALEAAEWLYQFRPYIDAYLEPPKTLEELQQDAFDPQAGYNIHHIVEQKSAEDDGFPDSMINGPDNLVRIPTLTHWLITGWYMTKNKDFGDLSPRDYLRGKSWDERMRVGKDALVLFGVLEP